MKIPKARRLKGGQWYIYLRLGGEGYGITASTEKDAVRKAQLFKAEWLAGNKKRPAELTLREAIDRYIEARPLSPSTERGYRAIQRNRYQNIIDKPISSVTGWESLVKADLVSHSVKSAKNAWYLICSVLKANGLTYPEVLFPPRPDPEPRYLTSDEIRRFVEAAVGEKGEIIVLLALHSLRRSELAALTWEDVDLKNNVIKVRGALVHDAENKIVRKEIGKSASATRTVPIMIPELRAALASVPDKTGSVVTGSLNHLIRYSDRIADKAGVPRVGLHGLRHTFASLAHHVGLTEREAMEIGGWHDAATMKKIYQHLERADRLKAENKMAAWYAEK